MAALWLLVLVPSLWRRWMQDHAAPVLSQISRGLALGPPRVSLWPACSVTGEVDGVPLRVVARPTARGLELELIWRGPHGTLRQRRDLDEAPPSWEGWVREAVAGSR